MFSKCLKEVERRKAGEEEKEKRGREVGHLPPPTHHSSNPCSSHPPPSLLSPYTGPLGYHSEGVRDRNGKKEAVC